jgi:dihydroorotase
MMQKVHDGVLDMETLVQKMCHNPAILFRVEDRGFLREGYYADLVLVDPNRPWSVNKDNILYKCGWSPFEGTLFKSRVTHTFVGGHLVFKEGQIDGSVKGSRLKFNR